MREEIPSANNPKASNFADQNQPPKNNNGNAKANSNVPKMKSSWGSNIVKGFSGDKKTKTRVVHVTAQTKKPPLTGADVANQRNNHQPPSVSNSRIKRSLIGDLSCSINATQVHPQTIHSKTKSFTASSEDLFLEIDHLRNLLQESKDREVILQAELSECTKKEVERELESKRSEVNGLLKKVGLLEGEKANLLSQVEALNSVMGKKQDEILITEVHDDDLSSVEMEVLELRRLNKELQLQTRTLSGRIATLEAQLAALSKVHESNTVEQIKAEASLLRHTNEDLSKQVEGLQISRMNEVEELAYLRWVNSCLRDELRSCSNNNLSDKHSSSPESICFSPYPVEEEDSDDNNNTATKRQLYLVKKFKKWPITDEDLQQIKNRNFTWDEQKSSARRHSISGTNCCPKDLAFNNKKRQSDSFICSKEALVSEKYDLEVVSNRARVYSTASLDVVEKKRALRIANPPPRPSCSDSRELIKQETFLASSSGFPPSAPPPPPPPPQRLMVARATTGGKVQRAPQVVEFYHSLMKRESRKDCLNSGTTDELSVANVRSSMIDEIENRSSHLLAIKADVETQGEFVNSLIQEVNSAVYRYIEDVVAFVKWLDDELCFLVDERAVLKHFEWPEKKADTLREAAFGYRDLKRLEQEVINYKDDPHLPCDLALKKIAALSERMERTVHDILRTRDSLMRHCKEFHIPTDWMLDMGILSKIKFGSVKLAKMYMKRVAMELQSKGGGVPPDNNKDSSLDYMLLQGVRFAFRIHQFAGGFDSETMHAFEELRDLAVVLNKSRD
ncbi:hydroxyproline-rich glycoprotein family protein [Striga asiatica]|uniref:Hydroxyproline-rich glycoprotein family protein n=1 Tax=Striga asiatica TaxID=4170 RepID=A0A5A7PVX0_STRAF|nr:hydroxyproline-rich glycoprotein family protein [Striga asiatica]